MSYQATAANVVNTLRRRGARYTVQRSDGTYDPVAGKHTSTVVTTGEVNAVFLPTSDRGRVADHQIEALIAGKIRRVLASNEFPLVPGDTFLSFEGKNWKVVNIKPLSPDGETLVFQDVLVTVE